MRHWSAYVPQNENKQPTQIHQNHQCRLHHPAKEAALRKCWHDIWACMYSIWMQAWNNQKRESTKSQLSIHTKWTNIVSTEQSYVTTTILILGNCGWLSGKGAMHLQPVQKASNTNIVAMLGRSIPLRNNFTKSWIDEQGQDMQTVTEQHEQKSRRASCVPVSPEH